MHVYAFFKAKAALAFGMGTGIFICFFLAVMISAPFVVRLSEKAGFDSLARIVAYVGYTWLGFLFLFFSCSVAIDFYRLLVSAGAVLSARDLSAFKITARYAFSVPLVLSLLISLYGFFEARNIRIEKLVIRTPKISSDAGALRIAQISDIHLGLIVREDRLKRIIGKIKDAEPDILISTGDLVDGQICDLNRLSDLLKEIKPRYGKFAITGNHEFYAGIENSRCFIENAGFTFLRGEALSAGGINIAGIDDPAGQLAGNSRDISEQKLLSGLPRSNFTLFLKHRPVIEKNSQGLFDLQLSGHVHKGQIFPFSIITGFYYPIQSGLARVYGESYLYVSRGAGTWGPPIRFLSPPEVGIIELVHQDQQAKH